MKNVSEMKKEELVNVVCEMEEVLLFLENKISRGKKYKKNRKEYLLEILESGGSYSIKELSEKMSEVCGVEISRRNVSSLLSYLREDFDLIKEFEGYNLVKVGRGVGKIKLIKE